MGRDAAWLPGIRDSSDSEARNEERNLVVTMPNHMELAKGACYIDYETCQAREKGVHFCAGEIIQKYQLRIRRAKDIRFRKMD